jgi:hypothetical protein
LENSADTALRNDALESASSVWIVGSEVAFLNVRPSVVCMESYSFCESAKLLRDRRDPSLFVSYAPLGATPLQEGQFPGGTGNQKPTSNTQGLTLKAVQADTSATIGELEINVMVTMFVHPSVLLVIFLVKTRLDMMESN